MSWCSLVDPGHGPNTNFRKTTFFNEMVVLFFENESKETGLLDLMQRYIFRLMESGPFEHLLRSQTKGVIDTSLMLAYSS